MTADPRDIRPTSASAQTGAAIEPSVSVADVAKAMAVSTDAVRREIRRGSLVAEKVFGRVRIRASELERYRAAHRIAKTNGPTVPAALPDSTRMHSARGRLADLRRIEDEATG